MFKKTAIETTGKIIHVEVTESSIVKYYTFGSRCVDVHAR